MAEYLKDFRKRDQFEKCAKYCPLECDSVSYSITPNQKALLGSGNISEKHIIINSFNLSNITTYEEPRKHYIQIVVYYKELEYTLISKEPQTESFSFVSKIGGILSLFLGISFLSLIEIFEIIIECFFLVFG